MTEGKDKIRIFKLHMDEEDAMQRQHDDSAAIEITGTSAPLRSSSESAISITTGDVELGLSKDESKLATVPLEEAPASTSSASTTMRRLTAAERQDTESRLSARNSKLLGIKDRMEKIKDETCCEKTTDFLLYSVFQLHPITRGKSTCAKTVRVGAAATQVGVSTWGAKVAATSAIALGANPLGIALAAVTSFLGINTLQGQVLKFIGNSSVNVVSDSITELVDELVKQMQEITSLRKESKLKNAAQDLELRSLGEAIATQDLELRSLGEAIATIKKRLQALELLNYGFTEERKQSEKTPERKLSEAKIQHAHHDITDLLAELESIKSKLNVLQNHMLQNDKDKEVTRSRSMSSSSRSSSTSSAMFASTIPASNTTMSSADGVLLSPSAFAPG